MITPLVDHGIDGDRLARYLKDLVESTVVSGDSFSVGSPVGLLQNGNISSAGQALVSPGSQVLVASGSYLYPVVIALDNTRVLCCYSDEYLDRTVRGRILTVNTNRSITVGSEYVITSVGNGLYSNACLLDNNKVLLTYGNKAKVITVNGTVISSGTEFTIVSSGGCYGLVQLDKDKALAVYKNSSDSKLYAVVLTASGSTISSGTGAVIAAGSTSANNYQVKLALLTSDKVLAAYADGSTYKAQILTVSGTTVTAATPVTVLSSSAGDALSVCPLSDSLVLMVYEVSATTTIIQAVLLTVSGTSITVGTAVELYRDALTGWPSPFLIPLEKSRIALTGRFSLTGTSFVYASSIVVHGSSVYSSSLVSVPNTGTYDHESICKVNPFRLLVACRYSGIRVWVLDLYPAYIGIAQNSASSGGTLQFKLLNGK